MFIVHLSYTFGNIVYLQPGVVQEHAHVRDCLHITQPSQRLEPIILS